MEHRQRLATQDLMFQELNALAARVRRLCRVHHGTCLYVVRFPMHKTPAPKHCHSARDRARDSCVGQCGNTSGNTQQSSGVATCARCGRKLCVPPSLRHGNDYTQHKRAIAMNKIMLPKSATCLSQYVRPKEHIACRFHEACTKRATARPLFLRSTRLEPKNM